MIVAIADRVQYGKQSPNACNQSKFPTHAAFAKCSQRTQANTDEINPLAAVVHGRHQESKQHLELLVELMQDSVAEGPRCTPLCVTDGSPPPENCGALAVALGNLGMVCRELGDADGASRMMEASLKSALSAASAPARLLVVWALMNQNMQRKQAGNSVSLQMFVCLYAFRRELQHTVLFVPPVCLPMTMANA